MNFEKNKHVFILNVWHEPREVPKAVPEWRGAIEYVATKEMVYFRSMVKMNTFILEKAGISLDVDSEFPNRPDDTE